VTVNGFGVNKRQGDVLDTMNMMTNQWRKGELNEANERKRELCLRLTGLLFKSGLKLGPPFLEDVSTFITSP